MAIAAAAAAPGIRRVGEDSSLEWQIRRLAELESACAQRGASEAKAAELVEQMRVKVRQFERQNAANVAGAEQELSRLSDDLQRSLHAKHTLEVRVREGDRRVDQLRVTVADLSAGRDVAVARRCALAEDSARARRQAAEETEAKDAAFQRLHRLALEAERLRSEVEGREAVNATLQRELASLRPAVVRLCRRERAELVLLERLQRGLLGRCFWALWRRRSTARARGERPRLQALRQRTSVEGPSFRAFACWAQGCQSLRRWRSGCQVRARDRLRRCLTPWRRWTRWARLCGARLCASCFGAWSQAARNVTQRRQSRERRRALQEAFRCWTSVVADLRQVYLCSSALARLIKRRLSLEVTRCWSSAAQACQARRRARVEMSQRQRMLRLSDSLRLWIVESSTSAKRRQALAQQVASQSRRRLGVAIAAFHSLVSETRGHRSLLDEGLARHTANRERRLLLQILQSLQDLLTKWRSLRLSYVLVVKRWSLPLVSEVLFAWRQLAARSRRLAESLAAPEKALAPVLRRRHLRPWCV
ncbi:unnamed protein product [Polarella glacialis]|uniref:Uncharacterized protein n=1 Tax=Polarella glacialis TaxID=89957 RepID=A0A813FDY9_POLGL|nr:unnamed protein product [Polarella glacialis]